MNTEYLLSSSEPWVVYRTLVDLLGMPESDIRVTAAKRSLLRHPLVEGLIREINNWPGMVLNSHKSAGQLYHKLGFIADLGVKKEDYDFQGLIHKMGQHISAEGLFQLPVMVPVNYGGSGHEQWAWALCDAPLLLYAALKMDLADERAKKGTEFLISLVRENGWPCAVSKELGKFRGPGKKHDPCPYVNLIMLKLLTLGEEYKSSQVAHIGGRVSVKPVGRKPGAPSLYVLHGDRFQETEGPLHLV